LPESRQLIQVAQSLSNPATCERVVRALVDAMRSLNITQGVILTDANAESVKENDFTITIHSIPEWLLSSS
jgi:hypothetical protein